MKNIKNIAVLSLVCAAGFGALMVGFGNTQAAKAMDEDQKAAIEKIIEEYLQNNPEKIVESLQAAQEKAQREREEQASAQIEQMEDFFKDPSLPSIGRPSADVTVVEFFDYNCGYCKRALPDVQKIAAKDENVRFVFMEMPILSQSSHMAALWATAAHKQGKYFEYHSALMSHRGAKNENELEKLARKVGLDIERMKADANSEEVSAEVQKAIQVGRDIGINGTPAFIINNKLFPGYIGQSAMEQAIKEAREG